MQGDFTRNTFDPTKNFTRVMMQQGRVQLDADWNEQAAILLHYMRALAKDLIGAHGGEKPAFKIGTPTDSNSVNFPIGIGYYYVDGLRCENNDPSAFISIEKGKKVLVYLDVWERHVTYIETAPDPFDQTIPNIREVALGGPDTATRTQLVAQVKILQDESGKKDISTRIEALINAPKAGKQTAKTNIERFFTDNFPQSSVKLSARVEPSIPSTDPCNIAPDARYRGAENQLYRVEVHTAGTAGTATFKWSRENGSVIFPILAANNDRVTLAHLGRDDRYGINVGDWVEYVDDDVSLLQKAHDLLKVEEIDPTTMSVKLSGSLVKGKHPYLRRWDQKVKEGIIKVEESDNTDNWISLENGVQVQFQKPKADNSGKPADSNVYQTGDYWLIPARTITGDIEWPKNDDINKTPVPKPTDGIEHHYALLAAIDAKTPTTVTDLRMIIQPIVIPAK